MSRFSKRLLIAFAGFTVAACIGASNPGNAGDQTQGHTQALKPGNACGSCTPYEYEYDVSTANLKVTVTGSDPGDTCCIQACLDALPRRITSSSARKWPSGGEVQLGPGVCKITRPINLCSGQTIRGAGMTATMIYWGGGAGGYSMIQSDLSAEQNCTVVPDQPTSGVAYLRVEDVGLSAEADHGQAWKTGITGIDATGWNYGVIRNVATLKMRHGVLIRSDTGSATVPAHHNTLDNVRVTCENSGVGKDASFVPGTVGYFLRGRYDSGYSGPNSNRVIGGHVQTCQYGAYVQMGNGNTFVGLDLESNCVGVRVQYNNSNTFTGLRIEAAGNHIWLDSSYNTIVGGLVDSFLSTEPGKSAQYDESCAKFLQSAGADFGVDVRDTGVGNRVLAHVYDRVGKIELNKSAKVLTGIGAPTVSAPEGSLFLRTDAGNGRLYVMENGAWVAK